MPVGATVAAASVASAGIGYAGAKSAAKTQANAADRASDVQLQMYNQTRNDLSPYRVAGGAALSPLARLLGIDLGSAGLAPGGGGAPAGGGGVGALTGGSLGGPDWNAYMASNPDVMAEYQRLIAKADPNSPWFTEHGLDRGPAGFAEWHYGNYGQGEGRGLQMLTGTGGGGGGGTGGPPLLPGAGTQTAGGAADIQSFLENLPGYQFAKQQGIQGVTRSVGSRGLTGAQAKGIARFVTGLADSTYGDQVNRLSGFATMGQNAANQTGQIGSQTAGGLANSIIGSGQASAAGTVGATNAVTGAIGNISNYALANKFLGMYGGKTG